MRQNCPFLCKRPRIVLFYVKCTRRARILPPKNEMPQRKKLTDVFETSVKVSRLIGSQLDGPNEERIWP